MTVVFHGAVQGDREAELGLPISPLCDRHNTLVAESQIGTYVDYVDLRDVIPQLQVRYER